MAPVVGVSGWQVVSSLMIFYTQGIICMCEAEGGGALYEAVVFIVGVSG